MTGFARTEGQTEGLAWAWELRSVNGKSLDLRLRLPPGWEALEGVCKSEIGELLKRGSVSGTLSVTEQARPPILKLNQAVVAQVVTLMRSLEGVIDATPPTIDGLLSIRGVIEVAEDVISPEQRELRQSVVQAGFRAALQALAAARLGEGERTAQALIARLDEIAGLVLEAEALAAAIPAQLRSRFQRQIATLLEAAPPLSEERLAQEVALLITRADVREELDRLGAHLQAARALLDAGANIGRRFDFLCQEFNREANTLCSKSADIGLTRVGIALKAAIEQLREQVQNIE
jgi:uncharacterized protein (TIGR00255 family)